jgi:hypothetical protein
MTTLASLIDQATAACNQNHLIGQARSTTRMVCVQILDRQVRKTIPTYRTDVYELPSGRRLLKAEWTKELA